MKRRLFTLASAFSLLLVAAILTLWVRSYAVMDDLRFAPTVLLQSTGGGINLITSTRRQVYVPDNHDLDEFRSGASLRWYAAGVEYLRYGPLSYDPIEWTVIRIPYYLLAAAAAGLPGGNSNLAPSLAVR